jgi:hypothetical protein
MVRYAEIKEDLNEYLVEDHRHLFEINGIKIEFWRKPRRNMWRIVTDLPIEELKNLQITIRDLGETLEVQEAWADLSRPIFATPPMESQLFGQVSSLETIRAIHNAILIRIEPEKIPTNNGTTEVKTPCMPKGRDVEDIANRLQNARKKIKKETTRFAVKKKKEKPKQIKQKTDDLSPTELYKQNKEIINQFILDMRREGHSYREISDIATKHFGFSVSKYRVGKVVRSHDMVNV